MDKLEDLVTKDSSPKKKLRGPTKFYRRKNTIDTLNNSLLSTIDKFLNGCIVDPLDYQQIMLNLGHFKIFQKFEKNMIEKLRCYMGLYSFNKHEVICSKYIPEDLNYLNFTSHAIILLEGQFRYSNNPSLRNNIYIEGNKIKISDQIVENEFHSQLAYAGEMIRDLNDENTFPSLDHNCIYSTSNHSWILAIEILPFQSSLASKIELTKNKYFLEFLRSAVPKCENLPNNKLVKLTELFTEKSFRAGEYICKESEMQSHIYLIYSGKVEVKSKINSRNQKIGTIEIQLAVYEPKQWINEDCVYHQTPSKFTIRCLTNTILYEISREDFIDKIFKFSIANQRLFLNGIKHKNELYDQRVNTMKNKTNFVKNLMIFQKKSKMYDEIKSAFPRSVDKFFTPSEIQNYDSIHSRNLKFEHNRTVSANVNPVRDICRKLSYASPENMPLFRENNKIIKKDNLISATIQNKSELDRSTLNLKLLRKSKKFISNSQVDFPVIKNNKLAVKINYMKVSFINNKGSKLV
jgi:CRP-like cAMP-binding protein